MTKKHKQEQLTAGELKFVANWAGNDTDAARKAGYKHPERQGAKIAARPRVAAAIKQKQDALVKASGEELGKAIKVSRNDIVNRLDELSQHAESDSSKISALSLLVDIYGLRARDAKEDPFAGWTEEECEHYIRYRELPPGRGPAMGSREGDPAPDSAPAGKVQPTKRS